jgi:hypothetical protein
MRGLTSRQYDMLVLLAQTPEGNDCESEIVPLDTPTYLELSKRSLVTAERCQVCDYHHIWLTDTGRLAMRIHLVVGVHTS